jgi:hypothetical protein
MNLIILYSPSFVVSNLYCKAKVEDLRLIISQRTNIPTSKIILSYKGKILKDENYLESYKIKDNSIIDFNEKLNGGTITGFPDIGHLIILFTIASIILVFMIMFYYTFLMEIIRPLKNCDTFQLENILIYDSKWTPIYWIILCIYSSIIVSILTLYTYSYWCSSFAITISPIILSVIISIIFAFGIIVYYYITKYEISFIKRFFPNYISGMKQYAIMIFTIILIIISTLFTIHLLFTSINKWILLYPLGILICGLLTYYIVLGKFNRSAKIAVLLLILLISFGTYTTAFVMNSADLCVIT